MNKRILLICPSNLRYMPYVRTYLDVFLKQGTNVEVLNWDRFGLDENTDYIYKDNKKGHRRNIVDYIKFSRFVHTHLEKNKYYKVIIFGIQLTFFLRGKIQRLEEDYIIDIRDYHKSINFFNISKIINDSSACVISSPGFLEWLPKSEKYIVNHNINKYILSDNNCWFDTLKSRKQIKISYIGSIRDYSINSIFIENISNSEKYQIEFHGEGIASKKILDFSQKNNLSNVIVTGRYDHSLESQLYSESDLININLNIKDINSRTLLTNRLYQSVLVGRPALTLSGTITSILVKEYGLGLVIDNFDNLEEKIDDFIFNFDNIEYNKNRRNFIEKIYTDNMNFYKLLEEL